MDRRDFLKMSSLAALSVAGAWTGQAKVFAQAVPQSENERPVLFEFPSYSYLATGEEIGKCLNLDSAPGMCAKLPMASDGIVRLSKIEVYPQYLEAYRKYAAEVGEVSLRTEPGVLTMYAISEKENPCRITILETYASREAYRSHIASEHFRKYKQGTLHMIKTLDLSDQTPLNPANRINNFIQ